MAKFLLLTDLDNTLVGDDDALAELNQHLSQHREKHGTLIVYTTGRSQELYHQLFHEKDLLRPDALILAVGTMILWDHSSSAPDSIWQETLSQNWDRDVVMATAAHFSDLVLQPASEQNEFKISFCVEPEPAQAIIPRLEQALKDKGVEAQVIYSSSQDLDILPQRGNKGSAMVFLRHALGMSKEQTVVCGDSGNDIAMFRTNEAKGIIVGNAQPELRQWHEVHPSYDRYLAKAHCAGGIFEGLQYFGFLENGARLTPSR